MTMINNGMVSILCPCYNSADYVGRMLNSILEQTYKNIEMICIDDGSSDLTKDIIESYVAEFYKNDMTLSYIKRNHEGQASAINEGLKHIRGKYFALIDSDDYLLPESVMKRVGLLENNPDAAVIASDYYIVDEKDLDRVKGRGNDYVRSLAYQPWQFDLLIAGYSVVTPIGYMIRTSYFTKVFPKKEINKCVEGQNYQILLPLYYYYKRVYTDEPLGYYVIRENSHDHQKRSKGEQRKRGENLMRMLEDVLSEMGVGMYEIERYKRMSSFNQYFE